MTLRWAYQSVPKAGNSDSENEDRVKVRSAEEGSRLRVAVADGATESSYSAEWAAALAQAWVELERDLDEELIVRALNYWKAVLPPAEGLPWYALARLEQGSHATGAFVEVRERAAQVAWKAVVVGDCVVVVRRFRTRSTVPNPPPRFGATPQLLFSAAPWGLESAVGREGRTRWLNEIWIATDAIAAALLERGRGVPWARWRAALGSREAFAELVDDWRSRGWLRNDDSTLVRIWRE